MQPPASLKALGDPIYEAFYGLNEQPFAITTDPRFFYLSASHQRAFSELLNGLRRREGLLLLTGDIGHRQDHALPRRAPDARRSRRSRR